MSSTRKSSSFSIDDILNKKSPPKTLTFSQWPRSQVKSAFSPLTRPDEPRDPFGSVPVTPDSTTSPCHFKWTPSHKLYFRGAGPEVSPILTPTGSIPVFFPEMPLLSPSVQNVKQFNIVSPVSGARFDFDLLQRRSVCKILHPTTVFNHTEKALGVWSQVIHRNQSKRKGGQIRFSTNQTGELERTFRIHKYLSPSERRKISQSLRLSERQVKTWFQNRRAKWRRLKQDMNSTFTDEQTAIIVDD